MNLIHNSRLRRMLIIILDVVIMVAVSTVLYVLSPVSTGPYGKEFGPLFINVAIMVVSVMGLQMVFQTYSSVWSYAAPFDYMCLILGALSGSALYYIISRLLLPVPLPGLYMVSISTLSTLLMILVRLAYRYVLTLTRRGRGVPKRYAAIVGAGSVGLALSREMREKNDSVYTCICFLDDDRQKIGRRISGIPVLGPVDNAVSLLQKTKTTDIFFAIPSMNAEKRREILEFCISSNCRIHVLPDRVSEIDTDAPLISQIRDINVEDLLERQPVHLDDGDIQAFLSGKTVLVTGGGGSIGSELCRQIAKYAPKRIIILDEYENGAYDLQQELRRRYAEALDVDVEIASVRDGEKITRLFRTLRPQIVFHAAAHKHVPLMEHNPDEAVKNNVFGTYNAAVAARDAGVQRFVLISTDKAVNPTSVMGTTKRICELLIKSIGTTCDTEYAAVRFGNVLGSNGSVVPLFQRQIASGGPVTVTDKRIIRYFMTIPEASQLVLQAGAIAKTNETFVLDMGTPVKILTLAENLIRLSGFIPYDDIDIVETGLRPGEKLYEELLIASDGLERTQHDKIFVERQEPVPFETLQRWLRDLKAAVTEEDGDVRACLEAIVPTFLSPEDRLRTDRTEAPPQTKDDVC